MSIKINDKKTALEIASDSSGEIYYITPHMNPMWESLNISGMGTDPKLKRAVLDSLPYQVLWTCTCISFMMMRARNKNPFIDPCKHITLVLEKEEHFLKELELVHAN